MSATTFEANGMRLQQVTANDGDPNDLLLTGFQFPGESHTIPALVFKKTRDAVARLASSVVSPTSSSSPVYTVSKSSTAGEGMFGQCELSTGELILTERPIIVTRAEFPADPSQIEPYLEVLFARLPQEHRVLFSNLQNCKSSLEGGPLLGRLRTNGFTFSPYHDSPPHAGIFPAFARCNHSCGPNALAHFNYQTWAIELRATRTIKAGEEIFISYVDVLEPSMKRRTQLASIYEFTCRCKWCTLPRAKVAESDARREDIKGWRLARLNPNSQATSTPDFLAWRSTGSFKDYPSQLIQTILGNVVKATREGLEPFMWIHVMTLYLTYAALGDEKNFKKWRTLFRDLILANLGQTTEFDNANKQLQDPSGSMSDWNRWSTQ